ncbi:Stk1 family PASTA domain-containing Ser/Thr kinase [Streptomyces sp. H10-C2]|uniref:Stk1 family PASTA domain-containing Ser/Thr kinase n=1 Tax=unclassified Streptomyces TaxID=2593676 RepID=UPI0024BB83B2|nr:MULTISPECIES: Stk1 family PASTA domain-containing Ser/Thr kinase [unclassified Streptomyces]MDJ0341109.1 Stk1 family PASTA domain-containing Ser/Thr kinase [Streptomyces sp. PH10-H1]MDJ0369539.1 Stk1 family PASTA domain-containing Ser/Thr kinase [Streptomyces sp. H10-C2]
MDTTLHDPLVGQTLDGRYRVEARIAVGGMATVYRAVDTRLDRVLALKVMHPGLAADAGFVDRFIREAKAVARLAHPNVVGVYDQGSDGTFVYLAMEYIAGCTLRDVLRERGALQPRAALDILEPVLAALGAAHRAGLIHRDVKPENVLIGDDGRVKVVDFGLVRAVDTSTSVTTGSVLGTVSYLAPEQIEHGTVDQRTDVYACGVLLYEMLTGGKPHTGGTPMQVIYHVLNEDIAAPSDAVPGLAPALDALVGRAAARDQRLRPADAVELLAQLHTARQALSAEQLDLVPPQALGQEPEDAVPPAHQPHSLSKDASNSDGELTSVIPRTDPQTDVLNRTSRLQLPPPVPSMPAGPAGRAGPAGPAGHGAGHGAGRRAPRRGVLALVVAVLLVLGVGAGVWYISDGQFTKVPAVLALSQADAERKIDDSGLHAKISTGFSLTVPRGKVISTDPAAGQRIRSNADVTLTISKGPQVVLVPDVGGKPLATAQQLLKDAALTPGTVTQDFSEDVPKGEVISTDPKAGTQRSPDAAVSITVSKGVPVDVPDVIGDSVADAQQALQDAGLTVVLAPEKVFSDVADKDKVAVQTPGKGAKAGEGDTVTITLSKGQQLFDVPDVKGKSSGEAKQLLKGAGFDIRVMHAFFGDTVFSQSPDGGQQAPKGATITVWVR